MKRNIKAVVLLLFTFTALLYAKNERYEIRSGIVKYNTTTTGKSYGMDIGSKGERTLYFKDWGSLELRDETISQNMMGGVKKTHSLTKIENGSSYSVDFDNRVIIKADLEKLVNKDETINKDILKANNAKKIGTGKVLGYRCDIWSMAGSKVWIYKGVVLKTQTTAMGIKSVENAVSAKFNVSIPNDKFRLPDYPIKTLDETIYKDMGNSKEPSNMPSQEEMQKMMKSFSNMMGN